MSKEKPLEITEEDKAQAEIEMKEKRVISLKIVKRFAHLIDSLPEDFLLETDVVNFLLKPLVEELYEGCIEDGACLNDIKAAGDLMGMFVSMSL